MKDLLDFKIRGRLFFAIGAICAVCFGAGAISGKAYAVELGLTPSNVVSLWTNVNNALITVAEISSAGAEWARAIPNTAPTTFSGKKPTDVLARVAEFREKLDRLRLRSGSAATKRYENADGVITPSVVFLNSGYVLDGVVSWIIDNTDAAQLVSPFYTRHDVSGKTPSDAFAMVDLANRRIDVILANSKI